MSTWDPTDLDTFGAASEIRIATVRADGTHRASLPIWVVRVGDALYVRSYRGAEGRWYRQVRAHPRAQISADDRTADVRPVPGDDDLRVAVDRAYQAKYGSSGFGAAMTTNDAAATTLRLDPA